MEESKTKIFIILLKLGMVSFHIGHAAIANSLELSLHNCSAVDVLETENAENIKNLSLLSCFLPILDENTFKNYTNIINLQIAKSEVENLKDFPLNSLKNLRRLHLPGNKIKYVNQWSQGFLVALQTLNLQSNIIVEIASNSFENYPNLQNLDLSNNSLEKLSSNVFRKSLNLKHLNLSMNRLRKIEAETLNGLDLLMELNLCDNLIDSIENNTFLSNSGLRILNLAGNNLKTLEFLKVLSLSHIQVLNLKENRITELNSEEFIFNSDVTDLDVSWNQLEKLHSNYTFKGLKSLKNLNLNHNNLDTFESHIFQSTRTLENLNLSFNNLSSIPAKIFTSTTLLKYIDLSHNKLTILNHTLFHSLPYLMHLNLSSNQLSETEILTHFSPALNHFQLTLDLTNNLYTSSSFNWTLLAQFGRVELAGNLWNCYTLLTALMGQVSTNIHFEKNYKFPANTPNDRELNVPAIKCLDESNQHVIVLLSFSHNIKSSERHEVEAKISPNNCAEDPIYVQNPSPPPLVWPKIRMDKFDSRSVIIWMLIAIALAFTALRVGRRLLEEKEAKTSFRKLKNQRSECTEMENLNSEDGDTTPTWARSQAKK